MSKESSATGTGGCTQCTARPADTYFGKHGPLCDACLDIRITGLTGLPRLATPPDPVLLTDPDGAQHHLRYRTRRVPTGVVLELREHTNSDTTADPDMEEGFRFAAFGDHDADMAALITAVTDEARREIGHRYLEHSQYGTGLQTVGDDVAGRFTWDPDGGPHRVVVDGRSLSWTEFGDTLASYEGWRFRLSIEDPTIDTRPDAEPDISA